MSVSARDVSRVIAGFLGAPLAAGVLCSLLFFSPFAGLYALTFAYPFALVLGIPGYFLLRKLAWLKFWQVSVAGAALGCITSAIFLWRESPGASSAGSLMVLGLCTVNGIVVAMTFWYITIKERP